MTQTASVTMVERTWVRAMPAARAATASRLSPYGSSCQHRIAIAGEA
jgi:hypothetical protein